jgi:hypothetical protein
MSGFCEMTKNGRESHGGQEVLSIIQQYDLGASSALKIAAAGKLVAAATYVRAPMRHDWLIGSS